ncbi:SgcJ/EcaC family oxidoreductase [Sphingopyxis lindanitolerans]|nr:SgcJ/EcaC family oxidoreductase [Sphingopyxis lindanitolerans]
MKHRALVSLVAIGLVTLCGAAQAGAPTPDASPPSASARDAAANGEQQTAADHLAAQFAESWNRRDGKAYGDAYWDDAELVDPSGQVWSGRAAIIQTHVDLWKGPARDTHMTAQVRRVQFLTADLFIVDIDTAASGFSPPPPGAPNGVVRTRLKHVVQRRNGEWKILASQNTFVAGPR